MTSNYNISVQEVYIEAELHALHYWEHLKALSKVGDSTLNAVQNLPSWVPDLSIRETPSSFEEEEDLYSADGGERPVFEVNGRVHILNAWHWDQIVSTTGTASEIQNRVEISRLLDVINIPGQFYVDSTELCAIAV